MTRNNNKVNGIIIVDKPKNITSNKLLQKVKYIFNAKKAGHTGNLDPMATGTLPICFGEATKVSKYLIESSKTYHVVAKLGEKTNTGDSDGIVTDKKIFTQTTKEHCELILKSFLGETEQIPPMFSAKNSKSSAFANPDSCEALFILVSTIVSTELVFNK